ncbi:predicted protein [Pyrenophora tritici-repentis Pt-1C-BFP]|uniref:Uncharacterized protein n=1 Tax=Pyrenophora tritici-repentis (strain Pt-1C-BFP) TaxID=426418 RepID=B2W1A1_PYRTR|nr:uncharacterized protein PTRG_04236 [Pyrenophora tritici-repentis Pt-1C-BFP]EDU47074.1 predicted protein [Pyrenophora tritici-repentis Pt-1C-BFP]
MAALKSTTMVSASLQQPTHRLAWELTWNYPMMENHICPHSSKTTERTLPSTSTDHNGTRLWMMVTLIPCETNLVHDVLQGLHDNSTLMTTACSLPVSDTY